MIKSETTDSPTIAHREVAEALAWLIETYPSAFAADGYKRALQIGIINTILSRDIGGHSPQNISKAVASYCGGTDYYRCLTYKETRVDLNGNDAELVSREQSIRAEKALIKRGELK